jgi:hypothetical protein
MPETKKVRYEKGFGKPVAIIGESSFDNDPFFIEKLEKAKKRLANVTFPIQVKK